MNTKRRTLPEELTYEEWKTQYPLIKNTIGTSAASNGCMFDTHYAEGEFVRQHNPRQIWTLVANGDEGDSESILSRLLKKSALEGIDTRIAV